MRRFFVAIFVVFFILIDLPGYLKLIAALVALVVLIGLVL